MASDLTCTCLIRAGKQRHGKRNANTLINLEDTLEVSVGRNPHADVMLFSNNISRNHAVLRKVDDAWTVEDKKSTNGVMINGKRVVALVKHRLKHGDIVQFGCTDNPGRDEEFIYTYNNPNNNNSPCDRKRKITEPEGLCDKKQRVQGIDANIEKIQEQYSQKVKEAEEMARINQEKVKLLEKQLKEKESENISVKTREEELKKEMEEQQLALERQKKEFEEEMRLALEVQVVEKEETLKLRLAEEKEALLVAKRKVEEDLKNEMEKKLEEKDRCLKEELEKEKEKLDKIIEKKDLEQKMLESQLNATKEENVKQKEQVLMQKQDILTNFADLMENELQCSICSELFVQATSLNCSHSYCAVCLHQWMKQKKICPVCRAPITSHIRSIVLDSYIDRMLEHLDEDRKKERDELVKERKAQWEAMNPKSSGASTSRGGAANRGGGGGGNLAGYDRGRRR